MVRACVNGKSSSNCPARRDSESVGNFSQPSDVDELQIAVSQAPALLSPETLRSSSTHHAMSLPKFPAVKMLKNPA